MTNTGFTMKLQQIQPNFTQPSEHLVPEQTTLDDSFWGKDGFTFGDIVDMFNPLHHLPVVSNFYHETTQDDVCEGAKIIGGALFGGLIGGVAGIFGSMANSAIRHETSQDVSEHLIAMVDDSLSVYTESKQPGSNVNGPSESQIIQVTASQESNPFFAQLIESVTDDPEYTNASENASNYRIREWGKV